jgi:uncharacterized protein (TIGR02145 family)
MNNIRTAGILLFLFLMITAEDSIAQSAKKKSEPAVAKTQVEIGTQIWTTGNLSTDKFRNGDPIQEVKTNEDWERAQQEKQPVWCYYRNDASRSSRYGKLYNWYAVNDPRGLAPAGWHIPTEAEWATLVDYLGGMEQAGPKLRSGELAFYGIAGSCRYSFGSFNEDIGSSYWWTSSASGSGAVGYRIDSKGMMTKEVYELGDGLSVRCVRD